MAWEDLGRWGRTRILHRFEQGISNDVRLIELNGHRAVARQGTKTTASLEWERSLMIHLAAHGLSVPEHIPALNGEFAVSGMIVMEHIEGREPETRDDWQEVVTYLGRVHELTRDWDQRPDFISSRELLLSGRVNPLVPVGAIPSEVWSLLRSNWEPLASTPVSAIHGDPNSTNIRLSENGLTMIDWDEARVDSSALDLGGLCWGGTVAHEFSSPEERRAFIAWDAAVCWELAPDHARKCVDLLSAEA